MHEQNWYSPLSPFFFEMIRVPSPAFKKNPLDCRCCRRTHRRLTKKEKPKPTAG
jgi:hypothetical protein